MLKKSSNRCPAALLASLLCAVALGPATQVVSAQCADPRGNAYCQNNGQVTFAPPPGQAQPSRPTPKPPTNIQVQNPTPPTNVQVQNPNPPTNVQIQNPNPPTNVDVPNPNATNSDVQNPNATNSDVQNPNAPITMAGGAQILAQPAGGAPGDVIAIVGAGFHPNDTMWLNVIDSTGQHLDTRLSAIQCVQSDNYTVVETQNGGYGCTSGALGGPLPKAGGDGTFSGGIQIPAGAAPGAAVVCIDSSVSRTCTDITIGDGN